MVKSAATTVHGYLEGLPEDRRAVVSAVRDVIVKNLPAGYREGINYGMIAYEIPLERYPNTYNKQPLGYVYLAAQKNYYSIYLNAYCGCAAQEAILKKDFEKAGKKLDMGKSCVRFRKVEDLPLDVIARAIAAIPPDEFIKRYEANRKK